MSFNSYSQSGEDVIIDFLFNSMLNIHDISYLDIGANDPSDLSNTFHFYEQGFSGLCIDPNPLFKEKYKLLRPRDRFMAIGVGAQKNKLNFFEMSPHTLSTFSEATAKTLVHEDGHELVKKYKVPVFTLKALMKKYFKDRKLPNFLNIDIEGWDYEIIEGLSNERWRPVVICIETITYSTKKEQTKIKPLIKLLKSMDYFIYADTFINSIFVDKRVWDEKRKNPIANGK